MKLEITPASSGEDGLLCTGTFKDMKFMFVKRSLTLRQQTLVAECHGKTLAKKTLSFDVLWLASIILDKFESQNLTLIGAIVLLNVVGGV